MKYQAVVFDFDMTLADSSRVIFELLNECVSSFGYEQKNFSYVYPVIGNTHEIMLRHVSGEEDPEKIKELRDSYRTLCRTKMAQKTTLFEQVPEYLRLMAKEGIRLGLLSLKLRDVLVASLAKYDLDSVFSVILGCEEVSAPKPDPSGLLLAMEVLGVDASETLYLGDSLVDEGAAKAAGVDFCAMLRGSTRREQFDSTYTKAFFKGLPELWSYLNGLE